jgi:hypothetical protein
VTAELKQVIPDPFWAYETEVVLENGFLVEDIIRTLYATGSIRIFDLTDNYGAYIESCDEIKDMILTVLNECGHTLSISPIYYPEEGYVYGFDLRVS